MADNVDKPGRKQIISNFADQLLEALGLTKDMNIVSINIHVNWKGELPRVIIEKFAGQEEVDLMKGKVKLGDIVHITHELEIEE